MRKSRDITDKGGHESGQSFGKDSGGLYVQSKLDWRLSKTEHDSRYRQCGQDMRELLEWIDRKDPKLNEREAVKLLRRVFDEQFEAVEGKASAHSKEAAPLGTEPYCATIWYKDAENKCARRGLPKRCTRETGSRGPTVSWCATHRR